jgi:hypothetical protein
LRLPGFRKHGLPLLRDPVNLFGAMGTLLGHLKGKTHSV